MAPPPPPPSPPSYGEALSQYKTFQAFDNNYARMRKELLHATRELRASDPDGGVLASRKLSKHSVCWYRASLLGDLHYILDALRRSIADDDEGEGEEGDDDAPSLTADEPPLADDDEV